jgi:integrase
MSCKVSRNRHGNLLFRLYWNGVECWEGIALPDTPENRKLAEAKAQLIDREMKAGTFEYLRWFPAGNKAKLFRQEQAKTEPKTIRQYYEDWTKDKVPPFVKKTRGRKYKSHFDAHILPIHGDKYLHLYGVADIRELRTELVDKRGLSLKTAKNIVNATLRAVFRDAKAEGMITKTPFDELPPKWWPKNVKAPPDPFTEEERDEIIRYFFEKYSRSWMRGAVALYALFWTGARPSELFARRWRDCDPRTGNLSIVDSRSEGEHGDTKTSGSNRTIPLLPPVREYLELIRPLRAEPDDYIFTNRDGKAIDQKEFHRRHMQPALRALKIRHRGRGRDTYATRATFISVMLVHGENPKRIAEYCGTSLAMIDASYGKWIRGFGDFGEKAMMAKESKDVSSERRRI